MGVVVRSVETNGRTSILNLVRQTGQRTRGNFVLKVCARSTTSATSALKGKTNEIHLASKSGDLKKVTECLREGTDVDIRDENGSSPLMWAASKQHIPIVQTLLKEGADPNLSNLYAWSALEYSLEKGRPFASPAKALEVRGLLFDAGAKRIDKTVPPDVLEGGFARILHSQPFPDEGLDLAASVRQFFQGAQNTLRDMRESNALIQVGGAVIAGVSSRRLGLYAGQRYTVRRLFYRRKGEWTEDEERIDVDVLPENDENANLPAEVAGNADCWEACAEVSSDTWMPWGSTELSVSLTQLRSVQEELRWAASVGLSVGAFWLVGLPLVLSFRLAFIPSASMEPVLHPGDLVVYSRGEREYTRGDVVLLNPPRSLTVMALERGVPILKGDLLVKRIVAMPGDQVKVSKGVLSVNGDVEDRSRNAKLSCKATCVPASYDFDAAVVPEGKYFVLGDNRGASTDSHIFGFIPKEDVVGKAFWKVVDEFGPLAN